jgi:hypothetical protein
MRRLFFGTCLVFATSGLIGQEPPPPRPTPMLGMQPTPRPEMLEIYEIDLVPSGSAFAMNKPVLEGDAYVFRVWPERDVVRLPKARVRGIRQRTKELDKFAVYQIELLPSGRILAREMPQLKEKSYVFHTWKEGNLMTLRQTDVKQVSYLHGLPAFKAQQEEKGAKLIGNLPMEGGGSVTYFSEPPPAPVNPADMAAPPPSNWNYDGVPGVTDAYAPANAVVERPGDPPKAPNPR